MQEDESNEEYVLEHMPEDEEGVIDQPQEPENVENMMAELNSMWAGDNEDPDMEAMLKELADMMDQDTNNNS